MAEGDAGLALRAALFDRLVPTLGRCTQLLIAPDGGLTRLPFEVLPNANGRRLLDDYQISYLSCGRDVLRFGTESSGDPDGPLVMADPDFDLEAVVARALAVGGPKKPRAGFWSRLLGRRETVAAAEPRAIVAANGGSATATPTSATRPRSQRSTIHTKRTCQRLRLR